MGTLWTELCISPTLNHQDLLPEPAAKSAAFVRNTPSIPVQASQKLSENNKPLHVCL